MTATDITAADMLAALKALLSDGDLINDGLEIMDADEAAIRKRRRKR